MSTFPTKFPPNYIEQGQFKFYPNFSIGDMFYIRFAKDGTFHRSFVKEYKKENTFTYYGYKETVNIVWNAGQELLLTVGKFGKMVVAKDILKVEEYELMQMDELKKLVI